MGRFSCEDAVILVLEEHGQSSTAFIQGRVDFKRETVYVTLRKMKEKGLVVDEDIPDWGHSGKVDSITRWAPLPPPRDYHRPSKRWSLVE